MTGAWVIGDGAARPAVAALAVVFGVGCGSAAKPSTGGPRIVAIDSVRLAETDSIFVAGPASMAVDERDRSLLVTDAVAHRALRFSRQGHLLRVYGRPGRGPGEFTAPGAVFSGPGVVAVQDFGASSLVAFDAVSGKYLRSIRYVGSPTYFAASAFSDTAWFGLRNDLTGTVVGRWAISDDTVAYLVKTPREYVEFASIGLGRITALPVLHWPDTLLVGFGPLNGLILHSLASGSTDTLGIPARLRRGTARSRIAGAGVDFFSLMNSLSILNALHRLPSGQVVLVHYDSRAIGDRVPRITADLYVSLLELGRGRACVDAPIPIHSDARPVVQFDGDTLLVLHQRVVGASPHTWVSRFTIGSDECDWRPVLRGRSLLE